MSLNTPSRSVFLFIFSNFSFQKTKHQKQNKERCKMVINGKKSLFVVSIFISLTLLFMFSFQMSAQAQDKVFKIGISQFVEHPALDSAREGFIESLSEAGFVEGENIEINIENAPADFSTN